MSKLKYYLIILILIFLISYFGIFIKSGRKIWEALIPGYNIYILFRILDLHIFLFITLTVLILFPITSKFFILLTLINFPFILADAFGYKLIYGFLILIFPIIFLPYVVYKGTYVYTQVGNEKDNFTDEKLDKMIKESLRNCL